MIPFLTVMLQFNVKYFFSITTIFRAEFSSRCGSDSASGGVVRAPRTAGGRGTAIKQTRAAASRLGTGGDATVCGRRGPDGRAIGDRIRG